MNLLEQFKIFTESNSLITDDRPSLLAVSGGVDSVAMAYLFHEADLSFGIAHCNFQLRGKESDEDEHFVRAIASEWGVPFFAKRFKTETYAEQNGMSIQMAARALRYAWFRETALGNGFGRVATAHNLNDSVETALLNFVRGTGLSGLKGIAISAPVAAADTTEYLSDVLRLIRPLRFATRQEIETFANAHHLGWREDSSNATDDYARNFLRHRVIPLLEELNPNFQYTAARNLDRLRETGDNLDFLLGHFFGDLVVSDDVFSIDKQKLEKLPAPLRALRELLKNYGFTEEQARQVTANLDHTGLELYSNIGWRLLVNREKILLSRSETPSNAGDEYQQVQSDDLMITLPEGKRLVLMHTEEVPAFPDGSETALLDTEKLRFPLLLRPWKPGDIFQPLGMKGHSQKLQDFFTNLKLSRFDKEKVLVMENSDGAIVWVIGYRPDERFKVTSDTRKFLKITYL